MATVEDIVLWMAIVVPLVVIVVIVGFVKFVKWGGEDNERNRIRQPED